MPYYKDIHTLFIHIPKTGGTKVEQYLRTKSEESLYSDHDSYVRHEEPITGKKYRTFLHDLPEKTVSLQHQCFKSILKFHKHLSIPFDKNLKIITIVRNPYDRMISDLFWFNLIQKTDTPEKVSSVLEEYFNSVYYDNHNIPQTSFLLNERDEIEESIHIMRTENLTKNMQNYGFTDFHGKGTSPRYSHLLNSQSIAFINNCYHDDFVNFGYQKLKVS